MARITPSDAQGWAESTKLTVSTLDASLLEQIESEIIGRLNGLFVTSTWLDPITTPVIVKVIIAKMYVAWVYDRQYSENQTQGNDYAALLRQNADMLLEGLLDGSIIIPGAIELGSSLGPSFYPNDASSAMEPTDLDMSLGPNKFSMNQRF